MYAAKILKAMYEQMTDPSQASRGPFMQRFYLEPTLCGSFINEKLHSSLLLQNQNRLEKHNIEV
jgi:hypothetical protein